MTHAVLKLEFEDLIDADAPVEQLGTGFTFTEGPIWHPVEHYLLFSDMPADVRRRWDARRGVVEVRRPSNKCNGMTYDADLNLIVCEHATSSLIRERPDGRREVLASHFEEQELNSPNDVCVRSDGSIYFSDPWYGRMPVFGVERPRQLGFQGVYRVPPDGGAPQLLVDRYLFDQPNGLCFSPDEKRLYVNDTVQALIRVFDVEADGSLVQRPRLRQRHPLGAGARRARRHEMRRARQCLGDRAGRRLGLCAVGRPARQGSRARTGRQSGLGRPRFPDAVHDRDPFGLHRRDQGRPAPRALYERQRARRAAAPPRTRAVARRRPAARSAALRADHPGYAERRHQRRRRFRRVGLAGPRALATRRRQYAPARRGGARARRDDHSCLVRRRTRRAGHDAQRAAVQGIVDNNAMVRGSWGAAPVAGLEPQPGD